MGKDRQELVFAAVGVLDELTCFLLALKQFSGLMLWAKVRSAISLWSWPLLARSSAVRSSTRRSRLSFASRNAFWTSLRSMA